MTNPPRYIRVNKFVELTGYTAKAVYGKIDTGVWIENRQYRRAPDGHICIDMEGYHRWVEGLRETSDRAELGRPSLRPAGRVKVIENDERCPLCGR